MKTQDDEITLMRRWSKALERMEPDAAERILNYLMARSWKKRAGLPEAMLRAQPGLFDEKAS